MKMKKFDGRPLLCSLFLLACTTSVFFINMAGPHHDLVAFPRMIMCSMRWRLLGSQKRQQPRAHEVPSVKELAKMPIWVVSLKEARDRRALVEEQMTRQNITFEFVDAVNGEHDHIPSEELRHFKGKRQQLYRAGNTREMRKVGADVANLRLMHRALAGPQPFVAIMEDDFVLVENFIERLHKVMRELPADWDVLSLNGCSAVYGGCVGKGLRMLWSASCSIAVIVRRRAAEKLIAAAEGRFYERNWDNLILGYIGMTGHSNSYIAVPPLCLFNNTMKSTIENTYVDHLDFKADACY